jgi:hypothetical protein
MPGQRVVWPDAATSSFRRGSSSSRCTSGGKGRELGSVGDGGKNLHRQHICRRVGDERSGAVACECCRYRRYDACGCGIRFSGV